MADPSITHENWFSNCNFSTRSGLHEIYVKNRQLIPQEMFMYVSFLRGGVSPKCQVMLRDL